RRRRPRSPHHHRRRPQRPHHQPIDWSQRDPVGDPNRCGDPHRARGQPGMTIDSALKGLLNQVLATGSEASSTGSSVDTGGMSSGQHGLRAEAPLPSFLDVAKEMQTHTELEWEREGNVSTLIPHQIERLETTRVTMTIPGENTLLSYGKKL